MLLNEFSALIIQKLSLNLILERSKLTIFSYLEASLQFKLCKFRISMKLNIKNETSPLQKVVVGIAQDRGNIVYINNPKISKHLQQGTLPGEASLIKYVDSLADFLETQYVEVLRPQNIPNQDQIFARDIAFVIDDIIIKSQMKKSNRRVELLGIDHIFNQIEQDKILEAPVDAFIEGGDVIVHDNYVFVGLSGRTNYKGYEFIKSNFPNKEVIPLQLYITENPATNILHLDCTFQPVGDGKAIIYENGFVHEPTAIYDIFGDENLIKVTQFEMYHMYPNIFSVSTEKIISDITFVRLNDLLTAKGIEVLTINYSEVGKLGGLFRCSTLPLYRSE